MGKGRLEAFTDGVMAIIITIMVLEIKVPHGTDLAAFSSSLPILFTYALSFLNVGIFWNNHHHMLHAATRVDGKVLWANLFLLFWLSLIPFVIRWIDETHFEALPIASYGIVLAMAAIGYHWLQQAIVASHGDKSMLAVAVGRDFKGGALYQRYRPVVCEPMDRALHICGGGAHVAGSRPLHRSLRQERIAAR
jgi:uncharacterized membrane protein